MQNKEEKIESAKEYIKEAYLLLMGALSQDFGSEDWPEEYVDRVEDSAKELRKLGNRL